jgi:hypothetical protein
MKTLKIISITATGAPMRNQRGNGFRQRTTLRLEDGSTYAWATTDSSKKALALGLAHYQTAIKMGMLSLKLDDQGQLCGVSVQTDMSSLRAMAVTAVYSSDTPPAERVKASILAADPSALVTWGAEDFKPVPAVAGVHLGGLSFRVNGAKSGRAIVTVTLAIDDTTTVVIARMSGTVGCTPMAQRENVPGFELMKTIDCIIERD